MRMNPEQKALFEGFLPGYPRRDCFWKALRNPDRKSHPAFRSVFRRIAEPSGDAPLQTAVADGPPILAP